MSPRADRILQAATAGAAAGMLAEVMVFRLNPEVPQAPASLLIGAPLWATWGAVGFGLSLLLLDALVGVLRRHRHDWRLPELTAVAYFVAAVMCQVNARLHDYLLSETALRVLDQDAIAWLIGATLVLVAGAVVRRAREPARLRVAFAVVVVVLPLLRVLLQPTPPGAPLEVEATPIGSPQRPLVVVGIEGLDSTVVMGRLDDTRSPNLADLERRGCWGPLTPHRPFLRRSLWTTLATGTYPASHGVKSKRGWLLPWLPDGPLRLLPWTPQGSRLILPWGLAREVLPPPASVPPLWERLRASGMPTTVVDWPGIWPSGVALRSWRDAPTAPAPRPPAERSLALALEAFPEESDAIRKAIRRDRDRLALATSSLDAGAADVWVLLEGLMIARSELEPLEVRHTAEREVVDLALEVIDQHVGAIVAAAGAGATVVVVSPYGLEPPRAWERLQRLLGIGGGWRMSPETSPDGVLMLAGPGVAAGQRFRTARLVDVVPTLCYLQGLPTAPYMAGGVIVDAIEPDFLSSHPLRVAD